MLITDAFMFAAAGSTQVCASMISCPGDLCISLSCSGAAACDERHAGAWISGVARAFNASSAACCTAIGIACLSHISGVELGRDVGRFEHLAVIYFHVET